LENNIEQRNKQTRYVKNGINDQLRQWTILVKIRVCNELKNNGGEYDNSNNIYGKGCCAH
jgi:hypothetical protein